MRELAKQRKEKDPEFEEKRMNLSVEVTEDEKIVTKKSELLPENKWNDTDDRENKENQNKGNVPVRKSPPPYESKGPPSKPDPYYDEPKSEPYYEGPKPRRPDPYYDDPKMQRDPYYDHRFVGNLL
jgi:hypothetical protein